MNRGLRPVLESLEGDGCPIRDERTAMIYVNGSEEIDLEGRRNHDFPPHLD